MAQRCPLTPAARERIALDKGRGRTLVEIADELGCSVATVRKWWRIARDHGRTALHTRRRGRAATGVLGRFNPLVLHQALQCKRANPRWGAARVLVELQREPSLHGLPLPSRSRLALLFKIECPECIAGQRPKRPPPNPPPRPSAAHECWQLDMQESIRLDDGRIATICTIRDPVGAAILAAQAFDVSSPGRYRKLRWREIRQVIRRACTRWQTLPDALQTDNEVAWVASRVTRRPANSPYG